MTTDAGRVAGLLVALGAAAPLLVGCGPADVSEVPPERAFVDLELTDASVAPSSRRDWTLLMDHQIVLATVMDGSEIVHEQQTDTPATAWRGLLRQVPPAVEAAREAADGEDGNGCAGATTLRVRTYQAESADDVGRGDAEVVDDVSVTSCSRAGAAAIADLQELVTPLVEPTGLPDQARTWSGRGV